MHSGGSDREKRDGQHGESTGSYLLLVGLAISNKKIIPRKTEQTEQLVCSGGIPAVPRNRKLSEFCSAEEKNVRNSVPWEKHRSKLSEFHCEPFSGINNWNSVPNHSAEEKTTRSKLLEFRYEAVLKENILFAGAGFFVKQIFFMLFPSIPSLGIDSSINLGITDTKSIPRNFFRNEIPLPTLYLLVLTGRGVEGAG